MSDKLQNFKKPISSLFFSRTHKTNTDSPPTINRYRKTLLHSYFEVEIDLPENKDDSPTSRPSKETL